MPDAIHKAMAGDTLASVAGQYYSLGSHDGRIRDVELRKVIDAVRKATQISRKSSGDNEALPPGTTLRIPTLRELNRAVFTDHPGLLGDLKRRGFDHARKLLRHDPNDVARHLSPLPPGYSEGDIRRAWMLTALLNLDGMDLYTARYLHDVTGIGSMEELASQSRATIDAVLATLIGPPHSRPPELAAQGHAARWIVAAKVQVRGRIGELTKIRGRFFQVPFSPSLARSQAEFYEATADDAATPSDDAALASRLGRLHRFQAAVLRGNFGLRAGNWGEAIAGYQEARRQWHRLAEETGAASAVRDDEGVNLDTCIDVARRLLESCPGEEDAPLGAPTLRLRTRGVREPYRLRGFRYDELAPTWKQQLRDALSDVPIHRLPRRLRSAIYRATLGKTRGDLKKASADLPKGLSVGADSTLVRDFDQNDRDLLRRNLGGVPVSALYGGASGLDVFESVGAELVLAEIASVVPGLWKVADPAKETAAKTALSDILLEPARASYPAELLKRPDVTPFTKFVVLPGETGFAGGRFLPVTETFAQDYEIALLKPRLMSMHSEDVLFDEASWASAGSFAAIAPYIYAAQIPLGLRRAYGRTGQMKLAKQHGGQRVNFYAVDGARLRDVGAASPSSLAFDPDLLACSTDWDPGTAPWFAIAQELESYASTWIGLADFEYRKDRRETARSYYADVRCAIEQLHPEFADETRLALTGVYNTIQAVNRGKFVGSPATRNLAGLTTLNVEYVRDGVTHQVLEGTLLPVNVSQQRKASSRSGTSGIVSQYFEWNALVGVDPRDSKTGQEVVEENLDHESSGDAVPAGDDVAVYVDHGTATLDPTVVTLPGRDEFYALYLYCEAKINAVDAGLNWYGYGDEFVPCWSFEHLYGVSRDLCNRGLEAEQRVFSLLQMYETALEQEFLATQQEDLAGAQLTVAEAQVSQQVANNNLATAQAEYTQAQAQAQENKSQAEAIVALSSTAIHVGAIAFGVVAGGPVGAFAMDKVATGLTGQSWLQSAESTAIAVNNHKQDQQVLNAAVDVTLASTLAGAAALSVAIAERDVASLHSEQASAYVDFLLSKKLNSDAYLYLMGRAKEILEIYTCHANRMAWLAERALENETRQAYDLIQIDYAINDGLADMTRAQQLTADLEALRSEYVAGQTARLQELKWTVALSQIDPIAWRDLRETGTCTFVLRQRTLDLYFPGMYQHRLKDIRLEIVGLIPPEGARGVFTNPGVSWVRVPNEESFLADQVKDDWVTSSLAGSTIFPQYDQFVMKRLLTNVVTVALSQFDVRADRMVLSAPQGMLKPVEHQGLDAAWTITLHRQSNNFDFKNIVDAELTFWFLAGYDPGLEQAQENALSQEGLKGALVAAAKTAFAISQPDAWAAFVGELADPEALDLRYLTVDVANLPLWEKERKVTNVLVGCARAESQSNEITLRLCCQYDPVGFLLTTKNGAVYSLIGIDRSAEVPRPAPDPAFEQWVRETFYLQIELPEPPLLPSTAPSPPAPSPPAPGHKVSLPIRDPNARWVIKAASAQIGSGWLREDEDGNGVTTSSGPLLGAAGGTATYRDGTAWTDLSFQVKLAHRGSTLRLRIRANGANHYALQISPANVKLFKVVSGVDALLGSVLPYAYPADEYLSVDLRVVGHSLTVAIDGLALFDNVDGAPGAGELKQGTVAIEVLSGTESAAFDDTRVIRLTGRGAQAETLLAEPFTKELPQDWVFVDGDKPWSISPAGHRLLDLSSLLNLVLSLDYRYQMNLN